MTNATDWAGAVGDVWAAEWRRTDRSFAGLAPVLDAAVVAAAPERGRAVDLGCGSGSTALALAKARPDLHVTGVDLSPELIRVARGRGGPLDLNFRQGDLAADPGLVAGADLLLSRHGVMFFADPAAVFAAWRRAVAPGARMVFTCFRDPALNTWASELVATVTGHAPAPSGTAPGPFAFADADRVAGLLAGAGWTADVRAVDFRYVAGEGADPVADAAGFFRRIGPLASALRAAPEAERPVMLARLNATLAGHRDGDRIDFPAAAWLWTAHA